MTVEIRNFIEKTAMPLNARMLVFTDKVKWFFKQIETFIKNEKFDDELFIDLLNYLIRKIMGESLGE